MKYFVKCVGLNLDPKIPFQHANTDEIIATFTWITNIVWGLV